MNFLEKDLEDIIHDGFMGDLLWDRGFHVSPKGYILRQVHLGAYGVADIVIFGITPKETKNGERDYILDINVIELKRDIINTGTIIQSLKYRQGITDFVEKNYGLIASKLGRCNLIQDKINVTLVGRSIEDTVEFKSAFSQLFSFLTVYTYSYEIDGMHFYREDPIAVHTKAEDEDFRFIMKKLDGVDMSKYIIYEAKIRKFADF